MFNFNRVMLLAGMSLGIGQVFDLLPKSRDVPPFPGRSFRKTSGRQRRYVGQTIILDRSSSIRKFERGGVEQPISEATRQRHIHPAHKRPRA